MFLGSGQDKFGIGGRFFECFEESIESSWTQHVYLIDDVYFILTRLWGNVDLFHQFANVVNRGVGSGIELKDVHGSRFVEATTRYTFVAGFLFGSEIGAVDGFGQNTGTRGFPHTTSTAKKKGLRKLSCANGILQCSGDMRLSNDTFKSSGTVLTC